MLRFSKSQLGAVQPLLSELFSGISHRDIVVVKRVLLTVRYDSNGLWKNGVTGRLEA
jgi:hypothetical protein